MSSGPTRPSRLRQPADAVGPGGSIFLNDRPDAELPILALHTDPRGRHLALQVDSLAALRTVCAKAQARGLSPSMVLNHRVSISVYFHDPDGNEVECILCGLPASSDTSAEN